MTERERLEQALDEALRTQTLRTVLLIQAIAARTGINPIDLQCLNLLELYGPLTPSRLAEAMSLTKGGAITAMIDRLEAAGYLHRRRDTRDRRQVLLHIARGEPLQRLRTHFDGVRAALDPVVASYGDDALRLITRFITDQNEIIHRLRVGEPAASPSGSDLAAGNAERSCRATDPSSAAPPAPPADTSLGGVRPAARA